MKSLVGSALIVLIALTPLLAEDIKRIGLDDASTLGPGASIVVDRIADTFPTAATGSCLGLFMSPEGNTLRRDIRRDNKEGLLLTFEDPTGTLF